MSEKIIKLQSQQAFNETWLPANNPIIKLADFQIPGGGGSQYDFSSSYININMEVVASPTTDTDSAGVNQPTSALPTDTALYNNDIALQMGTTVNTAFATSCSTMVRNASIMSQNKGMVESIREVNKLRGLLYNFENDQAEMHGGLEKFGNFQGRRGPKNATSSLVQIMGSNVDVAGEKDFATKAQGISRDFRIPLSDLFGVGNVKWNGDYFGNTDIHLELEPQRLIINQLGGDEAVTIFDPTPGINLTYGACFNMVAANPSTGLLAAAGTLGVSQPILAEIPYFDFGLQFPFYVGQAVQITANVAAAGALTHNRIISAIEYNVSNATASRATPGLQFMRIFTRTPIHTNGTAAGVEVTGILIKALKSDATKDQIRINKAEIVLKEVEGEPGPEGFEYTTYSTESTQGNGQTPTYHKQIVCEPNAQNLVVCSSNTGDLECGQSWESYRLSINQRDVAGNRDIPYRKPLHWDRCLRFFRNRNQTPSNLSFNQLGNIALAQGADQQQKFYPVLETLPLTAGNKIVDLEFNGIVALDVTFFKELTKSI